MNKKLEDQLCQLAFGDLPEGEAEHLRQAVSSDPKLAQALQGYRDLRQELGCLRDVPEMQISRDRLRDAILAGGLKSRRTPSWSWLGAPVALAAAAFAATLYLRHPSNGLPVAMSTVAGPMIMDSPASKVADKAPAVDLTRAPNLLGSFDFSTKSSSVATAPVAPAPAPRTVSRVRTHRTDTPPVMTMAMGKQPTSFGAPMSFSAGSNEAVSPSAVARMSAAAPPEPPVVVIDNEKDRDTGAQRATEVESVTNVVIGG